MEEKEKGACAVGRPRKGEVAHSREDSQDSEKGPSKGEEISPGEHLGKKKERKLASGLRQTGSASTTYTGKGCMPDLEFLNREKKVK